MDYYECNYSGLTPREVKYMKHFHYFLVPNIYLDQTYPPKATIRGVPIRRFHKNRPKLGKLFFKIITINENWFLNIIYFNGAVGDLLKKIIFFFCFYHFNFGLFL